LTELTNIGVGIWVVNSEFVQSNGAVLLTGNLYAIRGDGATIIIGNIIANSSVNDAIDLDNGSVFNGGTLSTTVTAGGSQYGIRIQHGSRVLSKTLSPNTLNGASGDVSLAGVTKTWAQIDAGAPANVTDYAITPTQLVSCTTRP
jgi:hypothetical protein